MRNFPWGFIALVTAILGVALGFGIAFHPWNENMDAFYRFVNTHSLAAEPSRLFAFYSLDYFLKAAGGYVTALFIHNGWMHVLTTAWPLAFFGAQVEKAVGWKGLLAVFFIGGIVGELSSSAMLLSLSGGDHNWGTIGASPAMFALIAVFLVAYAKLWREYYVRVGVALTLLVLEAIRVVATFSEPAPDWFAHGAVNHASHLGGFIVGLAFAFWLVRRPRKPAKGARPMLPFTGFSRLHS